MQRWLVCFLAFWPLFGCLAQSSARQDTLTPVDARLVLPREVVVTAQRQQHDNYRLPVVTTVLDQDYFRRRVASSVPDVLFGVPGIFLQKTNQGGGSPFLRGLTGQQTLLLVDGIRLNNATFRSGPNQYLNTIDPGWVARLEVLGGGGATEYGSDAIGGVVHVQTHTPGFSEKTSLRSTAAFQWMSAGMERSGQLALTGSGPRWALRADGAYRHFGDLVAGRGLGKESPNGYSQWSTAAKFLYQLSKKILLSAAYQDLEQSQVPLYHKVQLENFKYNAFDPQRRQLGYLRLQGDFKHRWWQKVELTASCQRLLEVRKSQKNGAPTQVAETDNTRTVGLQISVRSRIMADWTVTTGLEAYSDGVRSNRVETNTQTQAAIGKRGLYPDRSSMQSWAAYHLHTYTGRRFTLTGGLRYNAFHLEIPAEAIGTAVLRPSALVGNLGLSWAFSRHLRLFGNAATAFRAPNVDDLGTLGIVDFRYELPNYSLQPEQGRSLEAGVKIKSEVWSATCSAYHLQLSDLIGRVPGTDSLQGYRVYHKENITQAYVRGLEARLEWRFQPRWLLAGHANRTFGQNTTANEPLRRVPPFHGRLYLEYAPQKHLHFRAESIFAAAQRRLAQGDRDDNRIAAGGTPGWQIFNAAVFYQYKFVRLTAEGHNVANAAYRTHGSGVDGRGRSLVLRLGLDF